MGPVLISPRILVVTCGLLCKYKIIINYKKATESLLPMRDLLTTIFVEFLLFQNHQSSTFSEVWKFCKLVNTGNIHI